MKKECKKDLILSEIQSNYHVRKMKKYIQHGSVSTYDHCVSVAELSYRINRRFRLHSDLRVLLTGAMLHDFYLYDWHEAGDGSHRLHGFRHPARASRNAKKYIHVDEKTSRVITSHMWPLIPWKIPLSREAWIVCLADKWISTNETLFKR